MTNQPSQKLYTESLTIEECQEKLLQVLDTIGESAQFCVEGERAVVLPGLVVEDVDEIGLPISAEQAQRLIHVAAQAPFGRGEDTIVDTSVRQVWQIEPAQFSLENDDWLVLMDGIVEEVKQAFGLTRTVECQLYKLLIYETGSFFAPHRDSEKQDGMFATLVVSLPSAHTGGELLVHHDGQSETLDFGGPDGSHAIQFGALYADCQHEVLPVTSGYRVSLIYNLSLARQKKQPQAPALQEQADLVAAYLSALFTDPKRDKVAIPLKHQYTEVGFDPALLKGGDFARIEVLTRAVEALQYQAYVALLTLHQSGSAEDDGWSYRSRRWGKSRYYDDDDDDDYDSDDPNAEFMEIFEETLTLNEWFDLDGHKVEFGEMNLLEEEVLLEGDFEGFHRTQQVEGPTGNEGTSLDRWYRHGVFVVWPQHHFFRILAGEGPKAAIPALQKRIASLDAPGYDEDTLLFAQHILACWKTQGWDKEPYTVLMLKQLLKLDNIDLNKRFLFDVLPRWQDGSEGPLLHRLCQSSGWKALAPALKAFLKSANSDRYDATLTKAAKIFDELCGNQKKVTKEQLEVCPKLGQTFFQTLEQWDQPKASRSRYRNADEHQVICRHLFRALYYIEETEVLEQFLHHALQKTDKYSLREVLIPAALAQAPLVGADDPALPIFKHLLSHCIEALQQLTNTPIPAPTDWKQDVQIKCKCKDCKGLQGFLDDPLHQEGRFSMAESRRSHLIGELKSQKCDMDTHTERRGSPYTLVCTKNRASYEAKCRQFAMDEKHLQELELVLSTVDQQKGTKLEIVKARKSKALPALQVGMSVRVNEGVADPDAPSVDLGGWQGRILSLDTDEDGEPLVTLAWDSLTIKEMPFGSILSSAEEDLDWSLMVLAHREVTPCAFRDLREDVEQAKAAIEARLQTREAPSQ